MKPETRTFASLSAASNVLKISEDELRDARRQGCRAFRGNGSINEQELVEWLEAQRMEREHASEQDSEIEQQARPAWMEKIEDIFGDFNEDRAFENVTGTDLADLASTLGNLLGLAAARAHACGVPSPKNYAAARCALYGPQWESELGPEWLARIKALETVPRRKRIA